MSSQDLKIKDSTMIGRLRWGPLLMTVFLLGASAFVFTQVGFEGRLTRDTANVVYCGQQMAGGTPPYVSLFNHSGPLAPLIAGLVITVSSRWGFDDTRAVRMIFSVLGTLAVVAVYSLAKNLFSSIAVGMLAAISLLGFERFVADAASGPRTKVPMVLFEILCLLFASRKKWFWAGFCGSLALVSWQPAGIFVLTVLVVAGFQSAAGRDRRIAILRALAGSVFPILFVGAYFVSKDALFELFEGTLLFNLFYVERESTLIRQVLGPIAAIYRAYTLMVFPIVLGLVAMVILYAWRLREAGGKFWNLLSTDPFAALLISFPAAILWTLIDFQGSPDLFVLLPFLAIGFGWLLHVGLNQLMEIISTGHTARTAMLAGSCVALLMAEAGYYRKTREDGLLQQRAAVRDIETEFGRDLRIVSIGAPEVLVLLKRANPTRYGMIVSGIDNWIEVKELGGFEAWLHQLEGYDAAVIALGPTSGRRAQRLIDWLTAHYDERRFGVWTLFVKRKPQVETSV